MIRNRYIRYFLFLLLLVAVDRTAGYVISILAKKQARDNRIGLLIENKIPADIYILGSSRALNNYSPEVISSITGQSCYNLGVSGSNILFHEAVLDLILKGNKKPRTIIYNIDDYGTLYSINVIVFRKDVLYPYVDNNYVNSRVCQQLNRKEIATLICDSYRQNVNFFNAVKYLLYGREAADYKTTNFDSLGSNLLVSRPEDHLPAFGERNLALPSHTPTPEHLEAFRRIQQKCIDNNIKLVLVLPPLYTQPSAYFRKQVKSYSLPGVQLLDYTGQMQQRDYFFNTDHMNKSGAVVFSQKIATDLKNTKG